METNPNHRPFAQAQNQQLQRWSLKGSGADRCEPFFFLGEQRIGHDSRSLAIFGGKAQSEWLVNCDVLGCGSCGEIPMSHPAEHL